MFLLLRRYHNMRMGDDPTDQPQLETRIGRWPRPRNAFINQPQLILLLLQFLINLPYGREATRSRVHMADGFSPTVSAC